MSQKEPIFKKRTKQFTISFPISPTSYRHKLFFEIFSLLIIILAGAISVYRIVSSPNYSISQIATSIIVTLVLISNMIIILRHTIKMNKDDEDSR